MKNTTCCITSARRKIAAKLNFFDTRPAPVGSYRMDKVADRYRRRRREFNSWARIGTCDREVELRQRASEPPFSGSQPRDTLTSYLSSFPGSLISLTVPSPCATALTSPRFFQGIDPYRKGNFRPAGEGFSFSRLSTCIDAPSRENQERIRPSG